MDPLSESLTFADPGRPDKLAHPGQLAYADFERLEKEIDFWKKVAAENVEEAKKQAKKVEELKAQVLEETLAKKEQEMQVQTLKGKTEKEEELITTIETSLKCQICMEIMHRPYALPPCGHILCLSCLQEWFRKAPARKDDGVDPDEFEDDSSYILNRAKTCPCCRTVITHGPIPVFVVKAIATALDNHRAAVEPRTSMCNRSLSPSSHNPWKGLFYSTDDDDVDSIQASEEDEAQHSLEVFEEDLESETGSELEVSEGLETGNKQDTDDDGDGDSVNSNQFYEYESVDVPARWEPPSIVNLEVYVFHNQGVAGSILAMLRRGCTFDMIRLFAKSYHYGPARRSHRPEIGGAPLSHVIFSRNNRAFLGWNILLDGEDTGESYMRHVLIDMGNNPEKWLWREVAHFPGTLDIKFLVRIEDVEHYDAMDMEDWLAHDPYD
ncbi:hypothetical protein C0993_002424 [Termitomyces sp. T159_Od127]|nr:hypothetical protein C0993_002424 [Termitomyces sp. T159_Od127]